MSYTAASSSAPNPPYHPHSAHHHQPHSHSHHHHHTQHTPNSHSVPPRASDSRQSNSVGQQARTMPRLGETRCYWALLNEDLRFLFLDPVLNHHLEEQGPALLGHRLLDFVHPDELQSATVDIKAMLDSRTLHGSVTRVRFTRLGNIRKRLGFQGTPMVPEFMRAAGVFYDGEYMPCNIVINVATDGLILCFIHAVIDVSPTEDNDEKNRTSWTNWCGTTTGGLFDEHTAALRQTLASSIPPHENLYGRVFQVLRHQPGRPTVFSWPPDLPGSDFAQLANRIEMELPSSNHTSDAKTSCTRRYKSDIVIPCSDGLERDIESIFVPYGCIIFACHRTKSTRRMSVPHTASTSVGFTYEGPQAYGYQQTKYVPPQPEWSGSDPWTFLRGPPEAAPAPAQVQQTQTQTLPERTVSPSESRSGSSTRNSTTLPEPPLRAASPVRDESPTEGGKEKKATANRGGGAPPHGVTKCSNCKIKSSPEWRKGPSGKKDLCNACGLRYARSRAKKEGTAPPPKKPKEKKDGVGPSRNGRKNSATLTASAAGGSYARTMGGGDYDEDGDGDSVPLYASNHIPTQGAPPPPAGRAGSPSPTANGSVEAGGAYYYAQHPQQQVYAAYGPGPAHGHPDHHQALSMLSRAAASEHAHHGYAREHGRSPGPTGGAVYVR